MKEYPENEFIQLSALQHMLFCERQCALIHVEQLWAENRAPALLALLPIKEIPPRSLAKDWPGTLGTGYCMLTIRTAVSIFLLEGAPDTLLKACHNLLGGKWALHTLGAANEHSLIKRMVLNLNFAGHPNARYYSQSPQVSHGSFKAMAGYINYSCIFF